MRLVAIFLSFFLTLPALGAEDPCRNAFAGALEAGGKCVGGSCRKADRVLTLCEMRSALVAQYSLLHQKKERLPKKDGKAFDPVAHLDGCITTEAKEKGDSMLAFQDRIRLCLAGFRDSHLAPEAVVPAPPVFVGFDVREVAGKFYVTGLSRKMISFLRDRHGLKEIEEELKVGTEVVSVDGKKPGELRDHYARYISASSEAYAALEGTEAITNRNFDYPTKKLLEVEVKKGDKTRTLHIPWHTAQTANREAARFLAAKEIPVADAVRFTLNAQGHWEYANTLALEGYYNSDTILSADDDRKLTEYYVATDGQRGTIAYRYGNVVLKGGRAVGYLQLRTFSTTEVVPSDTLVAVPFVDPLITAVKGFKDKELDVIVDLRANPGGQTRHAASVLSLFLDKGESHPGIAYALRVNRHTERLMEIMGGDAGRTGRYADAESQDLFWDLSPSLLAAFTKAVEAKATHTDLVLSKTVQVSEKVGGFGGRVVVLTTPQCVSTCDITAALFKKSKRAKLIGTASNGTGAGFAEKRVRPLYCDANGCVSLRIPNMLFGVPAAGTTGPTLSYEKFERDVLSENRPTAPDVAYETTVDDMTGAKFGWLERAVAELLPAKK